MIEIKTNLYDFYLHKNAEGKFTFTSENVNTEGVKAKYFMAELTVQGGNVLGRQSSRVVVSFMEGSKIFDDVKRLLDKNTIDRTTGESSVQIEGKHFRDYPCGFKYRVVSKKGQKFVMETVNFFVFADDNFEKQLARAIRTARKTMVEGSEEVVHAAEFEANNTPPAPAAPTTGVTNGDF